MIRPIFLTVCGIYKNYVEALNDGKNLASRIEGGKTASAPLNFSAFLKNCSKWHLHLATAEIELFGRFTSLYSYLSEFKKQNVHYDTLTFLFNFLLEALLKKRTYNQNVFARCCLCEWWNFAASYLWHRQNFTAALSCAAIWAVEL